MNNPNNNSAFIYDLASKSLRPPVLTDKEVTLITLRIEKGENILDIGGGTGRHALVLAQLGYYVHVVDSSEGMIEVLKTKSKEQEISEKLTFSTQDIFQASLKSQKFDAVTMFWNSFNEIALNKKQAYELLGISRNALNKNGFILINIDDASKLDPSNFDFITSYTSDNIKIEVHWQTVKFFKKSNTSISKEHITIFENNKKSEEVISFIKQKYWKIQEIKEIAKQLKLKVEILKIETSGELYLLLEATN